MNQICAVLVSLFALVTSDIPCILRESTSMITGDISTLYANFTISDNDVKFYFKSQQNPNGIGPVDLKDANQVNSVGFSATKDTAFVVHGWLNNHNSRVTQVVPKAFTDTRDMNVFVVDWSSVADGLYKPAAEAVPQIGKILGTNIQHLIANNNLNLDTTAFVGHSLGAHVSGIAGQSLGGQVGYIVGLDAAFPCFSYDDINERLDSTDGKYVEVIHTCAGLLGFDVDIGDSDFYPNGGSNQPGCSALDVSGSCSHGRAYEYYAESLVSSGFVAHKCDSYRDFQKNKCSGDTADMGGYFINKRVSGTYFLDTNSQSPYARN